MSIQPFIDYLKHEKKYSLHTVVAYENDLKNFQEIATNTYNQELKKLSYAELRFCIVSIVNTGVENRTTNRKISSLKAYFKYLLKTNQISENPLAKHKSLKVSKKVQVPFSKKEVEEVLSVPYDQNDFESFRNHVLIELLYVTGIRRSELINLTIDSIDFSLKQIKVLGKRNKERIIPLFESTMKKLSAYIIERNKIPSKNTFLFITKKGEKMYEMLVYRTINSYFRGVSSKLKQSPHIIRHSFATHLLNEGADLNSVKELLGHASLASTQVYTKTSLGKLKELYNHAHPRSIKNS
ncbi:tyrosine-type recombinase/integrase [Aureivirga sp. CE67]|uniref:tyrosine-type recombinase/integrase n=1 Tax=Aureivirga sp. CE67 TaxID=1788983 RepID=UPI0018CA835B|nr:tyrosine-type recombinase/integrase [Aureivirga sp. CE67]